MKHTYEIVFNNNATSLSEEYTFGRSLVKIDVGMQCAKIQFSYSRLKTVDDFITFSDKLFRDAYRKAILLHAVNFSRGLNVKTICISIDGTKTVLSPDNDPNGYFPYLFSMIRGDDLCLHESWKTVSSSICNTTKTKIDEDLRFAAAYSFLASKNRDFYIDRFLNLWTAMNAYYSYVSDCYERTVMKEYSLESIKNGKLKLKGKDSASMGLVAWLMEPRFPNVSDQCVLDELKGKWKKNYDVENELRHYSDVEIAELCDASYNALLGGELDGKYKKLSARSEEFGVSLFVFLLIEYSYNFRCRVFHGNSPTMLIMAYNDYEITSLNTINYFLERFLNENIPMMFQEDFWDENKQKQAVSYIEYLSGNKKDFSAIVETHKKNSTEKKR